MLGEVTYNFCCPHPVHLANIVRDKCGTMLYYSVSTRSLLASAASCSIYRLALLAARLLSAGVEEAVDGGVHVAVGRDQG